MLRFAGGSHETIARRLAHWSLLAGAVVCGSCLACPAMAAAPPARVRVIVETDAGGDPDDEQSLVRFLLYADQWDIEGILANRPRAIDGENQNPERTGPGIVRRQLAAYGECWPNLNKHAANFPPLERLLQVTVAARNDTSDAVERVIAAVDADEPRPLWFLDWGTQHPGAATSSLRRALDKVLAERGPEGYAKFKARLRLASSDAFGPHTRDVAPPFPLWVDTFRPELDGKRWYHAFSGLTATAGGFDVERDLRAAHGPLGALYPLNTTHRQKEGDTMTFLYLLTTGMNDPEQPGWGSWAGRYGQNPDFPDRPYYWANQSDAWNGTNSRYNSLARWAVALQHDFAARADWCVAGDFKLANHTPIAVLNGDRTKQIVHLAAKGGERVELSAAGSSDPDGHAVKRSWFVYPEAGTFRGDTRLDSSDGETTRLTAPAVEDPRTIHVILQLEDDGQPSLFAYRRAVITVEP